MIGTGECKDVMISYLACIKRVKGQNDPECRNFAKSYLSCRMERCVGDGTTNHIVRTPANTTFSLFRNLMAKDDFKNLGFAEDKPAAPKNDAADKGEKGEKTELLW
jgi:cytochrome c oxidase assembly protein subunit 19